MVQSIVPGSDEIVRIENLQTHFPTRAGVLKAVDGVSLSIRRGEVVGLVGESGSGKSVTGYSILGLVDPPGRIVGGKILFQGEDLAQASPGRLRALRGARIAMIFQDPMMTLNPVLRVGTQIVEAISAHVRVSRTEAHRRACMALSRVGISAPEERMKAYPHEFSGGMRQRVCIAIAMLHEPDLIVADEPTTALDVTIQAQILAEMQTLCATHRTALLWITHDLAVVAGLANSICVMYAGRIVEQGPAERVISAPRHPYTRGLIDSVPGGARHGARLTQIPGTAPSPLSLPSGCAFRQRCRRAGPACTREPPPTDIAAQHVVRCFHPIGAAP